MNWTTTDDYLIGSTKLDIVLENASIASFDLDDTLTISIFNKTTKVDHHAVEMYHPTIKNKLNQYINDNYKIVIITNQMGIKKGHITIEQFKTKMEDLYKILNIDFTVYASIDDNLYRKPRMKFWDEFIKGDKTTSFYCGDAGGLPKRKINGNDISKDFSDSDLKFALNLCIQFIHRDEFIYGVDYSKKKYEPDYVNFKQITTGVYDAFTPSANELIILVGFPASGKSYYAVNYIIPHGYAYINQDTMKTEKKCLIETEKQLKLKKNIIIDNTNLSLEKRKIYLDLAKQYKYTCRSIVFTTSIDLCKHNNLYRYCSTNGQVKIVPKIAYNIMKGKYVEPVKEEGFTEIIKMDFKLDSKLTNNNYMKYYD